MAEGLLSTARVVVVIAFVVVALVALASARQTRRSGWWAAAAFGTIAAALLVGVLPELMGAELPAWSSGLVLVLLLAFPYLLLRFTASFVALPRWLEFAAAALTLVTLVALVPTMDGGTVGGSFLALALTYWVAVSLVTVVRLWRAGRHQPTVARRSMRLMSTGTAVLAVALLLAGRLAGVSSTVALTVDVLALVSAGAFVLGFRPPRMLRLSWRQPEEARLRAATVAVLRARTAEEVARELLPPTLRIVNGSGAAMLDTDGEVVASFGDAPAVGAGLAPGDLRGDDRQMVAPLVSGRGELVVWTGSYSAFFGSDDRDLVGSMAAIADLALERCELLEEERARRAALESAQQETERARHEADRANTAKSEFLSRMSHELRTPLNAVLGFGQLLETAALSPDDRDGVGHILKAGRHLLALINDVLDLSRIEAGKMTISLEPVHAAELVGDTLALIRPLADSRRIDLRFDHLTCDVYVMTDRQRGRQVLLNLLSNAVKYNHDGGAVDVACSSGTDELRISVRDSGPGIEPSRRAQLFEPFERLGAEQSAVEGSGLGLALTKQLVERLGGSIGFDSAPGVGTTFWIDLPLTDRPFEDEPPTPPARLPVPTDERTLLLVEDNLTNLRVVQGMLRRRPGTSVIPAMQGRLALELAHEHRPDVIVLDLHLPDLGGEEVLNRLRSDPRTRQIPVVVASADASPNRVRRLREIGAYAYITKPLDLQRFLEVIDAAMAGDDPPEG
ncbi:MAG: ATP-binding protein [Nitriliruptor sp.]